MSRILLRVIVGENVYLDFSCWELTCVGGAEWGSEWRHFLVRTGQLVLCPKLIKTPLDNHTSYFGVAWHTAARQLIALGNDDLTFNLVCSR